MNAKQNMKSVSSIEQQIRSIQIAEHERKLVLHAARIAGMFVGAIVSVCERLARSRAEALMKRGAYYWE